jgi:asparagine synthetase B (glutamine-hydrolysing)
MAWGLEARVPFLDKKFLEVAMNIDAKYKEFNKGAAQETDAEGRPKMEKVSHLFFASDPLTISTFSEKHSTVRPMEKPTYPILSSGDKKSNSPMV